MAHHQFVGHREHDDPGDDRDMPIGERLPRDQAGDRVVLDMPRAAPRAHVEIEPPHRERTGKSVEQRQVEPRLGPRGGIGRAGNDQPFAQRDNNEQSAAFGHVAARNNPVLGQ